MRIVKQTLTGSFKEYQDKNWEIPIISVRSNITSAGNYSYKKIVIYFF